MAEAKQTNFRIDPETADAFRKFCDDNGYTQAQGFDHLMDVLMMDEAKKAAPDRKTDIEDYELHIKALMEAFLHSVTVGEDAKELAREEFKTQLAQRDKTIRDLQAKQGELQEDVETSKAITKDALMERDAAKTERDQALREAESATKRADATESSNLMLTQELTEAKGKLDGYDDLKKSEEATRKKIDELSHTLNLERAEAKHKDEKITELSESLEETKKTIEKHEEAKETLKQNLIQARQETKDAKRQAEKDLSDAQKDHERILSETKMSADKALSELKRDAELHEAKVLEQLRAEMNEQIQTLREKKATLLTKVELLTQQLDEYRKANESKKA